MHKKPNLFLVWDLDDTLYQQSEQFVTACNKFLNNQEVDASLYQRFKYHSDDLYDDFKNGILTTNEMRVKRIQKTLDDHGLSISDDEAVYWQKQYEYEQSHIQLSDEITNMLNELSKRNVGLGIITNGPSSHQRMKMKSLGIDKWFNEDLIIVSGDKGIHKPHKDIFQEFSDKIPSSANVYFIGDNYTNDVEGAHKFGWKTIWLNTQQVRIDESVADYEVRDYLELKDLLLTQITVTSSNRKEVKDE